MFLKDWKRIVTKAWSIRLMIIAGLLSGAEAVLSASGGIDSLPDGAFAVLSGVITCAALVARVMVQNTGDLNNGETK